MYKDRSEISDWLDGLLSIASMNGIAAAAFLLYEDGEGAYSMELVGTSRFDPEDDDWACDEVANFGTRDNPLTWKADKSWEEVQRSVADELRQYLKDGKRADVLRQLEGVAVGFADGDLEILRGKETA